jgi:transposase
VFPLLTQKQNVMGTNQKQSTENFIKNVRRKTRRLFSSEQKILIVMEALREKLLLQRYAVSMGLIRPCFTNGTKSSWKLVRNALMVTLPVKQPGDEVAELRKENQRLKEMVADLMLRYDIVKKLDHLGVSEKYQRRMRLTAAEKYEIIKLG